MTKKTLTANNYLWQPIPVPAIVGIGFSSSVTVADNAFNSSGVFLCPKTGIALYLGGSDGEPHGSLVPLCQSANLFGSPFLFSSRMGGISQSYISSQGATHEN